jgi:hypothetical protein
MTTHADPVTTLDVQAPLTRNILALTSGLALWTAAHFGVTAVLPLFLHDQGYDGFDPSDSLWQDRHEMKGESSRMCR